MFFFQVEYRTSLEVVWRCFRRPVGSVDQTFRRSARQRSTVDKNAATFYQPLQTSQGKDFNPFDPMEFIPTNNLHF
jgi:hypothetical protein